MWVLLICVQTMCAQLIYPTEIACHTALTTRRINSAVKHIAICVPEKAVQQFMSRRIEI